MITKIKIFNGRDNTDGQPDKKLVPSLDSIRSTRQKKDNKSVTEKNLEEMPTDFVNHDLPNEDEIRKIVQEEIHEAKEEEIEESLSEIYHDDKGNAIDVQHLFIKKKKGIWFYLFMLAILAGLVWGGYFSYNKYKYLLAGTNLNNVVLEVRAQSQVMSGEEFVYTINYSNKEKVAIKNIEISAIFPANFIILDSQPYPIISSSSQSALWKIDRLEAGKSGKIEIKGRLIMPANETGVIFLDMTYSSDNYSTVFKKSTSFETLITDLGIDFSFDNYSSVLVGQESEISFSYKAKEKKYLDNFRVSMNSLENLVFIPNSKNDKPGVWTITEIKPEEQIIKMKFKFNEKINSAEEISLRFDYKFNDNYYQFFEKKINIEVMKSTLNMNMIINGSRGDQGVDFDQTLNYSIVFANKGEVAMKNLVIMAVLDGGLVDWSTIQDENKGKIKNNTIVWTKNEVPQLSELGSGLEGTIDFTVKVATLEKFKDRKSAEIKSYAQFNIGDFASSTEDVIKKQQEENKDTRSNIIISKLNSDIELDEAVKYFNEDNIAVGSGPLPPKVGQTTSYKVYWQISNSLHELNDLVVETVLPDYVTWGDKNNVTVGSIRYESETRKVIWTIGRLPVSDYKVAADFSISITPVEENFDKIMVVLQGASIKALDTETNTLIEKTTKPKTTQLENDEIARDLNSDGRVSR